MASGGCSMSAFPSRDNPGDDVAYELALARAEPDWVPPTARLERAFSDVVDSAPQTMRCALLLVAAVDDGGIYGEVVAAASAMLGRQDLDAAATAAIEARLIEVADGKLGFRHPLMRSAIQQAATVSCRQRAHAALASVLEDQGERRARHRAASLSSPDESAAADLEAAAAAAYHRGDLTVAIQAFEGAAQLSPDPASRGDATAASGGLGVAFDGGVPRRRARAHRAAAARAGRFGPGLCGCAGCRTRRSAPAATAPGRHPHMAEDCASLAPIGISRSTSSFSAAVHAWWSDSGSGRARAHRARRGRSGLLMKTTPGCSGILVFGAPIERGTILMERLRSHVRRACARAGDGPRRVLGHRRRCVRGSPSRCSTRRSRCTVSGDITLR